MKTKNARWMTIGKGLTYVPYDHYFTAGGRRLRELLGRGKRFDCRTGRNSATEFKRCRIIVKRDKEGPRIYGSVHRDGNYEESLFAETSEGVRIVLKRGDKIRPSK